MSATGRVLLDTNIVIGLLRDDASVKQNLAQAEAAFLSTIVLGELYFGAAKSGKPMANAQAIDALVSRWPVVGVDLAIARVYGRLKQNLYSKGRPLPENDLWIAATALHFDLDMVTRDRHFDDVEDLRLEVW